MPFDATVIGSGPNGFCAAIPLAQAGLKVLIREAAPTPGGSCRSAELTLPGYTHDTCSTIHTLARASPFIRTLPLQSHGLEFIDPKIPFAHPLDNARAAAAYRSVDETARALGDDAESYHRLFDPLLQSWDVIIPLILGPLRFPRHPIALSKFAIKALQSARGLATRYFTTDAAQSLFAGAAAHATMPLDALATSSFALVLLLSAHAVGWPVARGGSQKLADALASYFQSLGGTIELNAPVTNIDELNTKIILADITPRQLLRIAAHRLPRGYFRRLKRFRYGPGAWKVDWALHHPIPWKSEICRQAGTIHLGGSLDEITAAEAAPWINECAESPYVLLVQPTLFDESRAPPGKHTAWAYCHVPNGSTFDMTPRIEQQIERFAPGFHDCIAARHVMSPAALEAHNPNLIGGDIAGGANLLSQLFTRPVARLDPYSTPLKGLYLCSASTPPGGGVHGMCGHNAAQAAMRYLH